MLATFKARAHEVSAEVLQVATVPEAVELVLACLRQEGVADAAGCYAAWADCPFLAGLDRDALSACVPGLRFDVGPELARGSRVGISQMDWAVADTGSIAQDATTVDQRLVSSLPLTHIAIVATDRLVPDLAHLLAVLSPEQVNNISLITGPSRTADIERVLTIGVHGPERLVIVFVDALGGAP